MKTTTLIAFLLVVTCVLMPVGAAYGRTSPVGAGDIAPDFTLTDQNGQKRSLSAERGKRPVVLVFYRGHW